MSKRGEKMQADVLAILRRRGCPLSAYKLLGELRESYPKIAPPTIYRALGALTERGRVHRLESLNAFIACQCDRHMKASILSICDDCGTVEESVAPDLLEELSSVAGKSGFQPSRHVIEIHGVCASCGAGQVPA
jgi:Fur family zinc uptake transcriptional regulator